MSFFLRNFCLRESCYQCDAKENKRSDITLGDFWGIERIAPEMNDEIGTSVVIVRTDKGFELFRQISDELSLINVTYEDAVSNNYPEYKSVPRPKDRDTFFSDLRELRFKRIETKYSPDLIKRRRAISVMKTKMLRFWRGEGQLNNGNYYLLIHVKKSLYRRNTK